MKFKSLKKLALFVQILMLFGSVLVPTISVYAQTEAEKIDAYMLPYATQAGLGNDLEKFKKQIQGLGVNINSLQDVQKNLGQFGPAPAITPAPSVVTTPTVTPATQEAATIPNATAIPNTTKAVTEEKGCVSTDTEYCLLEPIVINNVAQEKVKIADYVETMFKIGIGLAALFAVFMIILGGFQYMTSESIGGKGDGKEKIEGALWGLALALGSFLILNTINPQLLEFSGGLEPIKTEELAKRIAYTDVYLESNRKLDEIRARLDDCNRKADQLKASGDEVAANDARLKCKTDVAIASVSAKAETVGIKDGVFDFFSKDTSKEDTKTREIIINAGKVQVTRYYDDKILPLEKTLSDAQKSNNLTDVVDLKQQIDLLKTQKLVGLGKLDQEYEIQEALATASRFAVAGGKNNLGVFERDIENLKRNVVKRGNDMYNKFLKTYPTEAEAIRSYTSERLKMVDEAYKKGLERERSLTNSQVGGNP